MPLLAHGHVAHPVAVPVAEAREVVAERAALAEARQQHFVFLLGHAIFSAAVCVEAEQMNSAIPFWSFRLIDECEPPAVDPFDFEFPLTASGRVKIMAKRGVLPDLDWEY